MQLLCSVDCNRSSPIKDFNILYHIPLAVGFVFSTLRISIVAMVEFAIDHDHKRARVQWDSVDVEAAEIRPHPALHRSNSNISINTSHSRRGSIDPGTTLPIQYRTVSYQIAESTGKNAAEVLRIKSKAMKGAVENSHTRMKLTKYRTCKSRLAHS